MEVEYNLDNLFGGVEIARITSQWISSKTDRRFPVIREMINRIGVLSAKAQGLPKAITTYDKLYESEHIIYEWRILGFLKTGRKNLYLFDQDHQCFQVSPVCVLDFYVHFSCQRAGYGKQLFDHMLKEESLEPGMLALDRPSDEFLGFMKRHYGLSDPITQPNNFGVFPPFFSFYQFHRNQALDGRVDDTGDCGAVGGVGADKSDIYSRDFYAGAFKAKEKTMSSTPVIREAPSAVPASYGIGKLSEAPAVTELSKDRLKSSLQHQQIW